MSPKTYTFGLIGYPLGHSLSPQIHAAALHALRISGEYRLYPVPPDPRYFFHGEMKEQFTLDDLLGQMRAGMIHGLNVTIPHKQNVIPLLDELTPAARTIGAVNTIFMRDDKLVGDNTDAPGFWADLQRLVVSGQRVARSEVKIPHSALVLGAGGSARAVVYALLTHGWQVAITARRLEQATILRDQLSAINDRLSVVDSVHRSLNTDRYSLLVNTTPVGMHPHEDTCPWPAEIPLPKGAAIYDLVYNPRETLLVRRAREIGSPATTGLGMLVEQAALAFERWTGVKAPRDEMMAAASCE
jgi:shikimate dehydrogenase